MKKADVNQEQESYREGLWLVGPNQARKSTKLHSILFTSLLVLFLFLTRDTWLVGPSRRPDEEQHPPCHNHDSPATSWADIVPSEKLSWSPCFPAFGQDFYCARLTLPMDYHRPLNASPSHPKVHIAMVLLPGVNHSVDTGLVSESPLLINPGGPGGVGTLDVLVTGYGMREIVGNHHDLIGFDPRGIGATWPQADCFDAAELNSSPDEVEKQEAWLHRATWQVEGQAIGLPNSTERALADIVRRQEAVNKMCGIKDDKDSIFRYAGTPHVAQDMMSIVNAWDGWLEELRDAKGPGHIEQPISAVATYSPPDTKGKLVYWGFSYGTMLGATFAAMFPQSVGRLILDGVVETPRVAANMLVDSLRDTDAVLSDFFYYCHKSGPKCRLYREGDEARDIRERFEGVMASLEDDPLTVIPAHARIPVIIDASAIKRLLFVIMYIPTAGFPVLALAIDTIYRGVDLGPLVVAPDLAPLCHRKLDILAYPEDSSRVIRCSDTTYQGPSGGLEDFQRTFERLANVSYFADVWTDIVVTTCSGWDITPTTPPALDWERFPWGDNPPINTSFPIMFVSNTHDPVTPLRQGLVQAGKFVGAGLVEQLSDGHCSIAATSLCTVAKMRAYLDDGIVPDVPEWDKEASEDGPMVGKWEKCPANEEPFGVFEPVVQGFSGDGLWAQGEATRISVAVHSVRDAMRSQTVRTFMPPQLRLLSELAVG